jgi:hypothetical protein
MMELPPLLDIGLGLFLLLFGPLVISAGLRNDQEISREGKWQVVPFALAALVAIPAAVVSGWVYLLERQPQFLLQSLIGLLIAFACILNLWRLTRTWNAPFRQNFLLLNDLLMSVMGGIMGLSGLAILLTYPIAAVSADDALVQIRSLVHILGTGAGFGAITLMLLNLSFAEN